MRNLLIFLLLISAANADAKPIFDGIEFKAQDSILISDESGQVLYSWQADMALVPASLVKLATANLAIARWGLLHRFKTDFFRDGKTLWVKGYGDPFLVSEELDLVAAKLRALNVDDIERISIDNSHFQFAVVPGRSSVADPYNAPLSAVSANFNTAKLTKHNGAITSAEPQTPLTKTATKLARSLTQKTERVNLINGDNAQQNFAELLAIKLDLKSVDIQINQRVPDRAKAFYQHVNSHTVADVLRGTLEFSNNFMANQVFLKLAEVDDLSAKTLAASLDFKAASRVAMSELSRQFNWTGHSIVEGSGLSRDNKLSARQIDDLLFALANHKTLFKNIGNKFKSQVYAKTGTLNGVRSYAGFIQIANRNYRFVFNFNRPVAYRYREQMLDRLLQDLHAAPVKN